MNHKEIEQLEAELWDSANTLRANSKLTAAEYKDPVLGLILLRYAQNRYEQAKATVDASIPDGPRGKRAATKDDYLAAGAMLLPEQAQYDWLAGLPEDRHISDAINNAMRLIEGEYPDLAGVLPKNYQEMDADLLRELIRVFNQDAVKNLRGDVFGRIYEFFLMKFSMAGAGAQEGGEFFTPPSLVQLIVNLIQPDHGVIHDPACGSGGMFVQTGHFIAENRRDRSVNEAITCYGTELKSNNARLAKMNLAMHGIEGRIVEDNSFYADPHKLIGRCDFVMANPPFNVKKVDKNREYVKTDPRLFEGVGLPRADNGNYLWIQYFYHYLNDKGRAGFVMASSATDAGSSEKAIRQRLVETSHVDCIVSIGNNFFYTRSLPCHLWFLDKGKSEANADRILMIDARHTGRVVNSTLNDFSPGQLRNFAAIMDAYRGDEQAIADAANTHQSDACAMAARLAEHTNRLRDACSQLIAEHSQTTLDFSGVTEDLQTATPVDTAMALDTAHQLQAVFDSPVASLADAIERYRGELEHNRQALKALGKKEQASADNKAWKKTLDARARVLRALAGSISEYRTTLEQELADYRQQIIDWSSLDDNFPDRAYRDIEGLCKIVTRAEVADNDYSLTPGRYVGYSVEIDEDFDYKERMSAIRSELSRLHEDAQSLMSRIQSASI